MKRNLVEVFWPSIILVGGVIAQLILSLFTGSVNTDHISGLLVVWSLAQTIWAIYLIKNKII